jgi:hypothetical protein
MMMRDGMSLGVSAGKCLKLPWGGYRRHKKERWNAMQELKKKSCWSTYSLRENKYVQSNGRPAIADDVETLGGFAESASYARDLSEGRYPPSGSLALSLSVSKVISVTLLAAWKEDTGITGPAAVWATRLGSYTERGVQNISGTVNVVVLIRGKLPKDFIVPAAVRIKQHGFAILSCDRISAFPRWLADNGPTIVDGTAALAELLGPKRTKFLPI